MVDFNNSHKEEFTPKSAQPDTIIWWFKDGEPAQVDLRTLSTNDLYALRIEMDRFAKEQARKLDEELNRWETIVCVVCGADDLAHRDVPFVTWGKRGGHVLCPYHLMRFDKFGNKDYQDKRKLMEIFG